MALRPVKVSTPAAEADQPKLVQVGIVAAVCFAIGALWPTLSGLRLVPEVPSQADDKPKAAPKPPHDPASPPSTSEVPVAGLALNEDEDGAPAAPGSHFARVSKELIVNCHDEQDRKLSQCDKPAFEAIAKERLAALSSCEPAKGAAGTLSIGFDLDFSKEKITRVLKGKSTTFSDDVSEALLACAKREFLTATLRGVEHTHAKYLVFYMVELGANAAAAPADDTPVVQASGSATIVWNSARIRSAPEDGEVVSRILYGTRVIVTGRKDDWYRVRYDAKGNEGWIHKNALAM